MDPSRAVGRLSPGTRLVLINPHHKLFDEWGFTTPGEFLATALRLPGKDVDAAIVASDGSENGYIALTIPGVKSKGVIIAGVRTGPPDAEQKILLDLMSDGLIHCAVGQQE